MQTSTGVYLEELFASATYVSKQSKVSVFSVLYADMQISVSQGVWFTAFQIVLDVSISLSKKKNSFGLAYSSCSFIVQMWVWNEAV